jgi:hypothetical protein
VDEGAARASVGSIDRAKRGMRAALRPTIGEASTPTMSVGLLILATIVYWCLAVQAGIS